MEVFNIAESFLVVLAIIHLISLSLAAISVIILYKAYRKKNNRIISYFMSFFIAVFFWMLIYFATLLFSTGSIFLSEGWELATSHGFFLIGIAFLARAAAMYVATMWNHTLRSLPSTMSIRSHWESWERIIHISRWQEEHQMRSESKKS